jgi:septum formation protein
VDIAPRIYLASSSPRRGELLRQIHVAFERLALGDGSEADVDETPACGEPTLDYVRRIAHAKAGAALHRIRSGGLPPRPVLAADTALDVDGEIVGKPDGPGHACDILRRLAGRSHRVLTAVALANGAHIDHAVSDSQVRFRPLDDDEIRRYVATGEPLDKAGAYGIQGMAAIFVEEIRGSYSGIMGLPLFETALLLRQAGFPLLRDPLREHADAA